MPHRPRITLERRGSVKDTDEVSASGWCPHLTCELQNQPDAQARPDARREWKPSLRVGLVNSGHNLFK